MDFYDVLKKRRSMRGYTDQPVPDTVLEKLKEAVQLAPSGCNFQPFRFLFIRNEELRKKIAAYYPYGWLDQAPLLVAAVGNADAAWHRSTGESIIELDIGIAMEHLLLAATAEGLDTCWIGAFPQDKVNELLNLSAPWSTVAMAAVGYGNNKLADLTKKKNEELFEVID